MIFNITYLLETHYQKDNKHEISTSLLVSLQAEQKGIKVDAVI